MKMEILVGPVASGKSTYARQRADEGALIVCDDAIVLAVHGGNYDGYADPLKPLYVGLEAFVVAQAAAWGKDVVVDTGGRTRQKRARFAALGRSLGFGITARLFHWQTPEVHATRRWASDARGYTYDRWLNVCRRHAQEFQPVDPEAEGLEVTWHPS